LPLQAHARHVRGNKLSLLIESGAVTDLSVTSTNDTVLIISWGPPVDPNGVILSYSVGIIDLGDGTTVRQENTVSNDVTQMNLGISG
jgi:hypothetical protein